MKLKKIIVAVSLDEATQRPFHYLKEIPISPDTEIVLVNMALETLFSNGTEFTVTKYPSADDRPQIEMEIKQKLLQFKNEILPQHANFTTKVIFDSDIKSAFADYAEKEKADLVVVATRGKRGIKTFFDSSFAQYQLKHSTANVLVLR